MRTKKILLSLIACLLTATGMHAARKVVTVESITANLTLSEAVDYHITASDNCIASGVTVDLTHEDAWLFFDNVRPTVVKSEWLPQIRVNGNTVTAPSKAWVNIYKHGAVVIPYEESYSPLTAYTGELYSDESKIYSTGNHTSLGTFDNSIKSFKLKRGHMMTVAQAKDGSGYSRVFIAQDEDIEVPNLIDITNGGALYNKISYIRVMRWKMPAKKGAIDTDPSDTDCSWFYNYDASNDHYSNDINLEYANMWHHDSWNTGAASGNVSNTLGVTHTLGFNEPWNSADDGYMGTDPYAPISPYQYNLVKNGLRIGSMAATDGNVNKTIEFVKRCDELGLRIDFVAIHVYQYQNADWWYNYTRNIYNQTGRPVWITEFNNGANWTSEWWPSDVDEAQERQRAQLKAVIEKLDEAPWVERYSVYSNVEDKRKIVLNGQLTPAGEMYKAHQPGLAYNSDYEFVPVYPTFETPTFAANTSLLMSKGVVRLSITEPNGEYLDRYVIEKKIGEGEYELIREATNSTISINDQWDMDHLQKTTYRVTFYYCNETQPRYTEEVQVNVDVAEEGPIQYGYASFSKPEWSYVMYEPFENNTGIPFFGGFPAISIAKQSNQFTCSLYSSISSNYFRAKILPWGFVYDYDTNTLDALDYVNTASLPYFIADTLTTNLSGTPVEAGKITRIGGDWVQVRFKNAFDETPVVFPSMLTNRNQALNKAPAYPRLRNVTTEGFEIQITREDKLNNDEASWPAMGEDIGYFAITPGSIKIRMNNNYDLHIVTALTPEEVGGLTSTTTSIFPEALPGDITPLPISALQTSNDNYTSTLVYSSLSNTQIRFYKVRDRSVVSAGILRDQDAVGYMLFYATDATNISSPSSNENTFTVYEADGKLYLNGVQGNRVTFYDSMGKQILIATTGSGSIDISELASGQYYLLRSDSGETTRFIKQ